MKKKEFDYALLCIVFVHVIMLLFLFGFVKKEYHSDEVWSYGIANSSIAGAVFENADGDTINVGKWISGDVFHEYLTVQDNERFNFEIPYTNAKNDFHPPLSFFLIHFVSSLFPGTFSFWFFIPFNILAMVLCDIYIYRILKLYDMPRSVCLAGSFWMAFCTGGINMAVYLRMYALLTVFGLMMFYLSIKTLKNKKIDPKTILKLVIINVLGGLTCYEYFVFAFLVAFIICVILLFCKRMKDCILYGLSMLGGVLVALALFPNAIYDMLGNAGGNGFSSWETYPTMLQLKMLISMVLKDIIGLEPNPYRPFVKSAIPVLLVLGYTVLILSPFFIYVWKNKNSFLALKKYMGAIKNRVTRMWKQCKSCLPLIGVSLFVIAGFFLIMNPSISVYRMTNQAVRYFFVVYPLIELILLLILWILINVLFYSKKSISLCCISMCLVVMISAVLNGMPEFLSSSSSSYGKSISDIKNGQIIVLMKSDSGLARIVNLVDRSNSVLAIPYDDLEDYSEEIAKLDTDKEVYIALQGSVLTSTIVKDTWEQRNAPININDQNKVFGETQNDTLDSIEDDMDQYLKKRLEMKSIQKIGYNATLNDDFTLYKITK